MPPLKSALLATKFHLPALPASLQDQTAPSQFIATLSGGHRFILSYLTEQVLDQQSEEIRRFLLT